MNDVINLELDLSMLHPVYVMKIHDSFYISNDWENTAGCWNSSKFIKYFNAVQKFYHKMQMSNTQRQSTKTNPKRCKRSQDEAELPPYCFETHSYPPRTASILVRYSNIHVEVEGPEKEESRETTAQTMKHIYKIRIIIIITNNLRNRSYVLSNQIKFNQPVD